MRRESQEQEASLPQLYCPKYWDVEQCKLMVASLCYYLIKGRLPRIDKVHSTHKKTLRISFVEFVPHWHRG
jgi:hypothetical protein